MATPIGHGIVGYTLARACGVKSRPALALSIGAASLPDVDFLLGYVANGDVTSLHHEVITHRPAFPLLVGAATGLAATAAAFLRGRRPRPLDVARPAALATALVGSHVAMDRLPLPYDGTEAHTGTLPEVIASQAWNAVVDMAAYGLLAVLAAERSGANGRDDGKA